MMSKIAMMVVLVSVAVVFHASADDYAAGKTYEIEPKSFGFGFDEGIYGSYQGHPPTVFEARARQYEPHQKSEYEPEGQYKNLEKLLPPTYLS